MSKGDKLVLGIGLSHVNLKRLRNGQPISIDVKEMGFTTIDEVFVFSKKTEQDMADELSEFIGPDTKIKPL